MFMPNTQFDHAVVFVADLNQAIDDFTALGFQVTPGGSHGITENALLIFANQTYIELLALKPSWYRPLIRLAIRLNIIQRQAETKNSIYARLSGWICGATGPVDWCVRVEDIDASLTQWKHADIEILPSKEFSRQRTDGVIASWKLGGSREADLPFLIQDITPTETRVPINGTTQHANGAVDLIAAEIRASDAASACNRLRGAFIAATEQTDGAWQPFTLGKVAISYADMQSAPVKISVTLSYDGEQVQHLDISKTHGIGISLVPKNL